MFKKFFIILAIMGLTILGFPKPTLAAPAAVSLYLTPDGSVTSPVTVYLMAKNEDTDPASIVSIATEITFDATKLTPVVNAGFKPTVQGSGIWAWATTSVTGSIINIDGSTDTSLGSSGTLAAGDSMQIAQITFTLTGSTTTSISNDLIVSIVTQKTTLDNMFTEDSSEKTQPQPFNITAATNTPTRTATPVTVAPTAVPTAKPATNLTSAGPEDSIPTSFILGAILLSVFFLTLRARKAWVITKRD